MPVKFGVAMLGHGNGRLRPPLGPPSDATVASALLSRGELSDLLWRRSLNIAGQARRDGTNRMTLLEDLVRWGEDHTEYEYNERYTRR